MTLMATGQTLSQQELLRISPEHLNGQIIFGVVVHLHVRACVCVHACTRVHILGGQRYMLSVFFYCPPLIFLGRVSS